MSELQPVSKTARWTGRVMGVLPCLMLLQSSAMKFLLPTGVPEHFAELGWNLGTMWWMGVLEAACTVAYLVPRTAMLGAILLSGYLGGGMAAHVRIGDWAVVLFPLILGILLWGGLYLREPRLRALIPFRQ